MSHQAQITERDNAFYFLIHQELSSTMFWNFANSLLSNNTNYVAWQPMIKAFEYMACILHLFISSCIKCGVQLIHFCLDRVFKIVTASAENSAVSCYNNRILHRKGKVRGGQSRVSPVTTARKEVSAAQAAVTNIYPS